MAQGFPPFFFTLYSELTESNQLLAVASYFLYRCEGEINLLE